MARVGANLCSMYKDREEQEKFLSVITDAEWGIKLGKLEISIQPVFRQQPELKSSLIPDLVKNRKITPDIILQYCRCANLFSIKNNVCYRWSLPPLKTPRPLLHPQRLRSGP